MEGGGAAVDPFAFIKRECGKVTASQEESLLHAPFISGSADPLFLYSSPAADSPRPIPPADAPIMICSPPDTPTLSAASVAASGDGLGLGLKEDPPAEKTNENSPAEEQTGLTDGESSPIVSGGNPIPAEKKMKKSRVSKNKSKGPQIRSTESPSELSSEEESGRDRSNGKTDEFEKYRYKPPEAIKGNIDNPKAAPKARSDSRKLPATIQDSMEEKRNVASSSGSPPTELSLLDVVRALSGEPDMRFENTDMLDIAAMKGIHLPPPRWWRPGGYDAKPKDASELSSKGGVLD